jgi:NSS family neurotransmitter:Na+ symporter
MPGGAFFGMLFFILLVFAAWSSAIPLIEPAVAWLVENKGLTRIFASVLAGGATWAFGLLTVFSFNIWSDVKLLSMFDTFKDHTIFDLLDYLTANIMLPLGGLLIAVFAVWKMTRSSSVDELGMGDGIRYQLWRFLVRYITPVAVVIVFLNAVGFWKYLEAHGIISL